MRVFSFEEDFYACTKQQQAVFNFSYSFLTFISIFNILDLLHHLCQADLWIMILTS